MSSTIAAHPPPSSALSTRDACEFSPHHPQKTGGSSLPATTKTKATTPTATTPAATFVTRNEISQHEQQQTHQQQDVNGMENDQLTTSQQQQQLRQQWQQQDVTATMTTTSAATTQRSRFALFSEFISGSAGGLAGITLGYPIDTIKTRIQTLQGNTSQFNSTFTTRTEYWRGLYKGMLAPLLGELASNFVLFGTFGICKEWMNSYSRGVLGEERYSAWQESSVIGVSGAFAGLAISLVVAPADMIKIQLQMATGNETNVSRQSFRNCVRHLWQTNGFFHGYAACLSHQLTFYAAYFWIYEMSKRGFADLYVNRLGRSKEQDALSLLMAGGIAGTGAWALVYPTDCAQSIVRNDRSMNLRKMFQRYTVRDLYRGFTPTVLRAFPVNAVTFYAYEMTYRMCRMIEGGDDEGERC